jgi:hypothetical protein
MLKYSEKKERKKKESLKTISHDSHSPGSSEPLKDHQEQAKGYALCSIAVPCLLISVLTL